MAEKLKILVVAPVPPPRDEQGIGTAHLLELRSEHCELRHVPEPAGGGSRFARLAQLPGMLSRIAAAKRESGADVLYFSPSLRDEAAFLRDSILLGLLRRKFPKILLQLPAVGVLERLARLPAPVRGFCRRAYEAPDVAIAISQEGMTEVRELHAKYPLLIPPGFPDVWEDGPRRDTISPPTILFMDTVCEAKGVGVLIEACGILHGKGLNFHGKIVGSGPEEEMARLQKQAADSGASLKFLGPVTGEAKWDLFAESDIFCHPTSDETETFGFAAVEAMMSGLPVVTTKWRALPEAVLEGKSGFLAPPGDARALADKLARLLRDSILRQVMGTSARNRFLDHYRVDVFHHRMEEAFLLAGGEVRT